MTGREKLAGMLLFYLLMKVLFWRCLVGCWMLGPKFFWARYDPSWDTGWMFAFFGVSFLYRSVSCHFHQVFDGDEGRWKTTTMLQAFLVPGRTCCRGPGREQARRVRESSKGDRGVSARSLFRHLLPAELVHLGPKGARFWSFLWDYNYDCKYDQRLVPDFGIIVYNPLWYDVVWCSMIWFDMIRHNVIRGNIVSYNARYYDI